MSYIGPLPTTLFPNRKQAVSVAFKIIFIMLMINDHYIERKSDYRRLEIKKLLTSTNFFGH